jgi:hypothetical protein
MSNVSATAETNTLVLEERIFSALCKYQMLICGCMVILYSGFKKSNSRYGIGSVVDL